MATNNAVNQRQPVPSWFLYQIGACITAVGECSVEHHVIMDLTAGDIVKAYATVSGSNKTVTINSGGAGEPQSWFYGYLINS